MEYIIKYVYDTGDSINTYKDQTGFVELTWKNYEIALKNLKRLEEHYNQFLEINSYSKKSKKDILDKNKREDWFNIYYPENTLKLFTDNNDEMIFSCPWCGYFEKLSSIEIEIKQAKVEWN
jgi:hypothetical protein